ncbi:HIT family protein [Rhizobium sp. CG5]|uniref:HIT family protein n=1 Tax=Rhizobium sp. CG5 TaxID=2726076 RepID=UPI0033340BF5
MNISAEFRIFETEHWSVNQRMDCALPGYLIVSTKQSTTELAALSHDALAEFGSLLSRVQAAVQKTVAAQRVYIGRYGHSPGYPLHFHVIPICDWVEALFWQDERYRLLTTFADGTDTTQTDGAELTLFVWREFCERTTPPPISGISVAEAIQRLRATL